MSFDLAVWHSDAPISVQDAEKIYLSLCENPSFWEGEHASITSFYNDLTHRWPEIDTIPEEKVGDFEHCPWSCALDRSGMAILMCCVWSMADTVAIHVTELAYRHELVCFDPQARRVYLPASLIERNRAFGEDDEGSTGNRGFFARLFGKREKL